MVNNSSKHCVTLQHKDVPQAHDSLWMDFVTSSLGVEDRSGINCSGQTCRDAESQFDNEQQICEGSLSSTTQATAAEIGRRINEWFDSKIQSYSEIGSKQQLQPIPHGNED